MRTIKVIYNDGDHMITSINGTNEEIEAYYLGQSFNFGDYDWGVGNIMKQCVKVEFLS